MSVGPRSIVIRSDIPFDKTDPLSPFHAEYIASKKEKKRQREPLLNHIVQRVF